MLGFKNFYPFLGIIGLCAGLSLPVYSMPDMEKNQINDELAKKVIQVVINEPKTLRFFRGYRLAQKNYIKYLNAYVRSLDQCKENKKIGDKWLNKLKKLYRSMPKETAKSFCKRAETALKGRWQSKSRSCKLQQSKDVLFAEFELYPYAERAHEYLVPILKRLSSADAKMIGVHLDMINAFKKGGSGPVHLMLKSFAPISLIAEAEAETVSTNIGTFFESAPEFAKPFNVVRPLKKLRSSCKEWP